MPSQLDRIEKKVDEHIAESMKTSKKVEDMYFTIMGNPQAKIKGMADKVDEHEIYIQADRRLKWMGAGAWSILNIGFFAWIKQKMGW